MRFVLRNRLSWFLGSFFALAATTAFLPAQQQITGSVYQAAGVSSEAVPTASAPTGNAPSTALASPTPVAAPSPSAQGFEFTQRPGEHPLHPVLRVVNNCRDEIDKNVRDYTCTFVKQERIDGELGEKQFIMLKLMEKPFSVYMNFLKPYAGREVCYVAGQNEGKMVVLDAGFKRNFGKMKFDPTSSLVMKGQKRPVTDVGIRNLTIKLAKMWEAETKFAECEVKTDPSIKVDDRSTTLIQVTHPVPRQDFKFHIARLFIDNELKVPIHFDAFLWPEQGNGNGGDAEEPPLEESYTYQNLKLNNGFTAREFDPNNNPAIFQK